MKLKLVFAAALLASTSAFAADLPSTYSPPAAPLALPFSWTGFYVGAHVGYAWSEDPAAYVNPELSAIDLNTKPDGFYGGGQIGYNYQLGNTVFGIEADISAGGVKAHIPDVLGDLHDAPGPYTITASSDYSGTARARLGYSFGPLLPYITGGYAWVHSKVSSNDGPVSADATLGGWVLGGGLEYAFDQHWSSKLEYLHADFGNHTWFGGQAYASTAKSTTDTVRLGINYRF